MTRPEMKKSDGVAPLRVVGAQPQVGLETRDRRARLGFGTANVAVALFVLVGVFRLLPTRWWVVDGGAIVVGLGLGASGIALLRNHPAAERLTRVAAAVVLGLGLLLFA